MAKKIRNFVLNAAIYIGIVVAVLWGAPKLLTYELGTEYPMAAITSGSMWPALKEGDLILIKATAKESMKIGDIIIWKSNETAGGFIIHRVARLDRDTFTTKGDANFTEDTPVRYENIVGKTIMFREKPLRIPYLGFISKLGNTLKKS